MISKGELLSIQFTGTEVDKRQYPFNLPFIKDLDRLIFHPKVTFFVGENGMGKSTLIEAIAVASGFNAEGGTRNFNFNTRVSHSELHLHLKTARGAKRHTDGFFLRSESFFNLATEIERLDSDPEGGGKIIDHYGGKSLHEQSHGESFWALFMHRFGGNGFYILDEPEAALSPTRQMAMLYKMHQLVNSGSQLVIATHSPILIAYPDAIVYEFSQLGIQKRKYKETELFKSYANFIEHTDQHVQHLLKD